MREGGPEREMSSYQSAEQECLFKYSSRRAIAQHRREGWYTWLANGEGGHRRVALPGDDRRYRHVSGSVDVGN